jgi:DNA polymerase-3 subunit epsilon
MKPIIYFDLETTGTEVDKSRIVQIAAARIDPETGEAKTKKVLVNPGILIPKEASDVHGITDQMVEGCPTFKAISKSLFEYMDGCDLGGFNIINFDVPLLAEEFLRAGLNWPAPGTLFIDAMKIFYEKEPRTLSGAVKHYLKREHADAHDAQADILATIEVYHAQLKAYADLGQMDRQELHDFCQGDEKRVDLAGKIVLNATGVPVYSFGKDKGKSIKNNPGFAIWMLKNSFPTETKNHLKKLLGYGR